MRKDKPQATMLSEPQFAICALTVETVDFFGLLDWQILYT